MHERTRRETPRGTDEEEERLEEHGRGETNASTRFSEPRGEEPRRVARVLARVRITAQSR